MKLDPGKVDWCLLPKQEDQSTTLTGGADTETKTQLVIRLPSHEDQHTGTRAAQELNVQSVLSSFHTHSPVFLTTDLFLCTPAFPVSQ